MEFLVTLIHGTFAKGADWTIPEKSSLCKYLEEKFGKNVQFDRPRFEWEASNTHKARWDGSRKLLEEYKTKKRFQREDISHFVIAHSHGGSMLAYALRDNPAFAEALDGVAFLSTPFIQARKKLAAEWVLNMVPWVVAFLALMIATPIWVIGREILEYNSDPTTLEVLILLLIFCGVLLISFLGARAIFCRPESGLRNKLNSGVQKVVSEFSLSEKKLERLKDKTLILRANADEASSTLAAAHLVTRLLVELPARIAWLPSKVSEVLGRKLKAMEHRLKNPTFQTKVAAAVVLLGGLFVFSVIPAIKWWVEPKTFETNWPVFSSIDHISHVILFEWLYMGTWYALLAVAFISVTLAILAAPMIALLVRLAYGRWLLLTALFIELSVETMPPGEWRVNQLDLNDELVARDKKDAWKLTHSMSYDDPRAHEIIARWIQERLDAKSAIDSLKGRKMDLTNVANELVL